MIPISYNLSSLRERWAGSVVAILGVAGTVSIFIATLALSNGFRAMLVSSGSPDNAIVRRAGANAEMDSYLTLDQTRVVDDSTLVARGEDGSIASPEVVTMAVLPAAADSNDSNVLVRGVTARVLTVRTGVKMKEGRFLRFGTNEAVAGRNAAVNYQGLGIGSTLKLGGTSWQVVGHFDAGGSALDSEVWCDATLLNRAFARPVGGFQSMTARLRSAGDLDRFAREMTSDPRMTVQVDRETVYYEKASQQLSLLILGIGAPIVLIMALGSVFGALNTMYTAVAERGREIATLRAVGFGGGPVILSFTLESLAIASLGGALGCLATLPLDGLTTATMNFQTFSHMAFAFRVTPQLWLAGLGFALLMGLTGGLPPAIRAARLPVATALRGL